ncbi:hypothetical protein PhCBS80983_g05016 [Powellomyces hirtus]|uniref:Tudor domain-containing protein n=1 Tax=Powellomyces hirtus TaxID=109895 RepID=A0A507DXA2_9FUNG|nr:hypothetical protein PhCBS80983_g05016 [Powellomyces hirtus]
MAQELAQYQFQLDQVDEALSKDPGNEELEKLRGDLTELITLYSSLVQEQEATAAATETKKKRSAPDAGRKWEVGQTVSAKYSGNGRFYEGVIEALPEGTPDGMYHIVFAGYTTKESVKPGDVREISAAPVQPSANKKRAIEAPVTAATIAATNPDANKKKKKFKPKDGAPSKRDKEQIQKQQAWLSFATGGDKKRKSSASAVKPPMKKPSMFATPDDPMAKVGVIGSGKPMTQFQQRGKHIFQPDA